MNLGGTVHLAVSNWYFPTKVIAIWIHLSEQRRLELLANYLHFSGFENIEVVSVVKPGTVGWQEEWGVCDPIWVVRGKKP